MGPIYSKRDVRRAGGGCSVRPTLSWSDNSEETASVPESGVTSNASETTFLYSPTKGCSGDDSGRMKKAACGSAISQQQQQQQEAGKVTKWRRCMKLIGDRCRPLSSYGDTAVEYQPIVDNKGADRVPAAAHGRNYGEVTLGHVYDEIATERRGPTWRDKTFSDEEARRAFELQQLRLLIAKMHDTVMRPRQDAVPKHTRNRRHAMERESGEARYRHYVRRYQQLRQTNLTTENRKTAEEDEKRVLAELVRINMTANNIYAPTTCRCSYHDQQRPHRESRHSTEQQLHHRRRRTVEPTAADALNVEELPARHRRQYRYAQAAPAAVPPGDADVTVFSGDDASDSDDDDEGSTSLDDSGIGQSPAAPGRTAAAAGKSSREDVNVGNEIINRPVSADEVLTLPPPSRICCVSSSHFWYRHRHREENELRAMDRVAEWISRQTAADGCREEEDRGSRSGARRTGRHETEQRPLGHSSHRREQRGRRHQHKYRQS